MSDPFFPTAYIKSKNALIPEHRIRDDQPQGLLHGEATDIGLKRLGGQQTNDGVARRPEHFEDERSVTDDSIELGNRHLIQQDLRDAASKQLILPFENSPSTTRSTHPIGDYSD